MTFNGTVTYRTFLILICLLSFGGFASASTIGEDGLHKQDWFSITFKDVAEDITDANDANKRLAIFFEQRGCIYCAKMHETILTDPEVSQYIQDNYHVVQYNLFGDEEVIDLDGEALSEKEAARKWGVVFTPTILFLPEGFDGEGNVADAAVARMPGAFDKLTFLHLFQWVNENGYENDEHFQKYHARKIGERS